MNVLHRLWLYQAERFPLKRTVPLIVVFAAAGVTLSAQLAGRALPPFPAYLVAAQVAVLLFAQLRIADEVKDAEEDRQFRPERPVPRGLVTLRLLVTLGGGFALVQALLAAWLQPLLLAVLGIVWLWLALMSWEFFTPVWLRAHPVVYLITHMLIMPMIDFFTTACEWLPRGASPPVAIIPFLLLSFTNGCVLELGRKTWSPTNERLGVGTYSTLWGPRRAVLAWSLILLAALCLAALTGMAAGALWLVAIPCLCAAGAGLWAARRFAHEPTPQAQTRLDAVAGIWVLVSYASVGFLPLLRGTL